jgi:hypothetical protein
LSDPKAEAERSLKLLSKSGDSLLIFGNDADDMRGVGSGIDPRVNVNDLSDDAITYSIDRMKLSLDLTSKLKAKYIKPNQSYQELRQAFNIVQNEYFQAANVTVKYVGGVYVNRVFAAQPGAGKAFSPVPLADQKRAMNALAQYAFSGNAFGVQNELYPYLQTQRRGFGFFGTNEDPKIHERVNGYQRMLLMHLMNPTVHKRMSDTRLYGNTYSVMSMMTDLTNAIMKGDNGAVPTVRYNLQTAYVEMLVQVVNGKSYDGISQAAALAQLRTIEKMPAAGTEEYKAHLELLKLKIKTAFEK